MQSSQRDSVNLLKQSCNVHDFLELQRPSRTHIFYLCLSSEQHRVLKCLSADKQWGGSAVKIRDKLINCKADEWVIIWQQSLSCFYSSMLNLSTWMKQRLHWALSKGNTRNRSSSTVTKLVGRAEESSQVKKSDTVSTRFTLQTSVCSHTDSVFTTPTRCLCSNPKSNKHVIY